MADFNPDAYLAGAAAKPFDPDAYLGTPKAAPVANPADENEARLLSSVLPAPQHTPLASVLSWVTGGAYNKYAPPHPADSFGNLPTIDIPGHPGKKMPDLTALASPERMSGILPVIAGASLPGGAPSVERPPRPQGGISGALADAAESAAVRSTYADRTATRRAFKGSDAARRAEGRFMLDENIPLSSPASIRDAARGIQSEAGPEIGKITQAADQTGATVNLKAAADAAKVDRPIARLAKNNKGKAAYDEITQQLDDWVTQHGDNVPPSVAHDLRMQLDEMANWDQTAPKSVVKAWRAARGHLDSALDDTMKQTGLADQWNTANARFASARKLSNPETQKGLADIGAERRAGNRFVQPYEVIAGAAGLGSAAMSHPLGLALPLATVAANRYAMPVAARTLDPLSRAIAEFGRPPTSSAPLTAALGTALKQKLALELAPALAQQDQGNGSAR